MLFALYYFVPVSVKEHFGHIKRLADFAIELGGIDHIAFLDLELEGAHLNNCVHTQTSGTVLCDFLVQWRYIIYKTLFFTRKKQQSRIIWWR